MPAGCREARYSHSVCCYALAAPCPRPTPCYAISGTHVPALCIAAYARATPCPVLTYGLCSYQDSHVLPRARRAIGYPIPPIVLGRCYAQCGTDVDSAAIVRCLVLTRGILWYQTHGTGAVCTGCGRVVPERGISDH
eukprot:2695526-Rhodomonas_salina.1